MNLNYWEIAKISEDLEKKCLKFSISFDKLMKAFEIRCKNDEHFQKLGEYWVLAKRIVGVSSCVVQIAERIDMYREDIIAEKIDKLYKEDYAKHIIPGTNQNTENLIKELINIFRTAWDLSNEKERGLIKKFFKEMAILTPKILKLDAKINDKKK